ncbi:MAG: dephospho-CoA kinase [Planctomycetota bacterium]
MILGLVGTVGAGKSAAARVLRNMGLPVYDADAESRRVFDTDDVQRQMRSWWGDRVTDASGRVERSLVGRLIFEDAAERARLEALIHPRLVDARESIKQDADRLGAPGVVIDAPLLFEAGLDAECDRVLCVDAPFELRARRVAASRGWSADELRKRDAAQIDIAEKRRRADAVIDNTGDLDALGRAVRSAVGPWLDTADPPGDVSP